MPLANYSKNHSNFHRYGFALGELCLLGQKVTTPPLGIIWPQLWPFIEIKHRKLEKSKHREDFIPAKGLAHPPCTDEITKWQF